MQRQNWPTVKIKTKKTFNQACLHDFSPISFFVSVHTV